MFNGLFGGAGEKLDKSRVIRMVCFLFFVCDRVCFLSIFVWLEVL